jgi:hypothetical protein
MIKRPQEDLTKFCYRTHMKVEKFNNPLILWLPAGEPVAKIWQLNFTFENLVN